MDARDAARVVGWLSMASGTAMFVVPSAMGRTYHFPPNRALVRILGIRDIVIGAQIVRSDPLRWMRLRVASDSADMLIIAHRALKMRRPGSVATLAAGLGMVAVLCEVTRRLAREPDRRSGSEGSTAATPPSSSSPAEPSPAG